MVSVRIHPVLAEAIERYERDLPLRKVTLPDSPHDFGADRGAAVHGHWPNGSWGDCLVFS